MRNSFHQWVAKLPKKAVVDNKKKVVRENKVITTTGEKEHSKVDQVKKLDAFIAKQDKTKEETLAITKSIQCKMIHEGEIFISAEQLLWSLLFTIGMGRQRTDTRKTYRIRRWVKQSQDKI